MFLQGRSSSSTSELEIKDSTDTDRSYFYLHLLIDTCIDIEEQFVQNILINVIQNCKYIKIDTLLIFCMNNTSDEGYSRKASCALNLISKFLFF